MGTEAILEHGYVPFVIHRFNSIFLKSIVKFRIVYYFSYNRVLKFTNHNKVIFQDDIWNR